MTSRRPTCALAILLLGVSSCGADETASAVPSASGEEATSEAPSTARSEVATDGRLAISMAMRPSALTLSFENRTDEPLRIYLPRGEPFRANSTVTLVPAQGAPLVVPEALPHGTVIEEADFPLIAAGDTFEATQSLDLGAGSERRPGFRPGETVRVRWIYGNQITRWQGGRQTLDGPTKVLFGGEDIPHIWTGRLVLETTWTLPDA